MARTPPAEHNRRNNAAGEGSLGRAEMITILEEIARESKSHASRIQAIKTLREIKGEDIQDSDFESLDDEISARRAKRAS